MVTPRSKTMSGNSWRVVWARVLGLLFWLTSILWTCCLGDQDPLTYKYLDNDLYAVPVLSRTDNSTEEILDPRDEFDRRFPPPPLFPPPPPSLKGETNALLRQAIYNNLHEKIKKARERRKGDEKGKGEGSDNSGSTDWPCDQFIQQESSGTAKPIGPKGPTNPQGPPGPPGATGLPGPPGDKGRRGRKGVAGPRGPIGPQGVVGPPGPTGIPGRPGASGKDGDKGDRGEAGPRGPRGRHGPPGPQGYVGMPGARGKDGIPGLVIFPDETAMNGVELEGLLAYRQDNKQLYFRDHLTWRAIRVAQCGDGIVDKEIGEECDDGNNNNYDECSGCRRRRGPRCGNGIRETNEECDGRDFGGKACNSWKPRMTGTLYCTSSCMISYYRCRFDLR